MLRLMSKESMKSFASFWWKKQSEPALEAEVMRLRVDFKNAKEKLEYVELGMRAATCPEAQRIISDMLCVYVNDQDKVTILNTLLLKLKGK